MKSKFLNTSNWKKFKLEDLFEIGGSKTTPKKTLEEIGNGNYPYITTQATENGVAGYYNFYTEKGGCLTIDSAVLGVCFYQESDFSASDHVEILRPKFNMSKNIALFFTILLNRTKNILGYAYDKKRSQTALKQEYINLPLNSKGEIDWQFMEESIKQTKQEIQNIINIYKLLVNGGGVTNIYNSLSREVKDFIQGAIMQIAQNLLDSLDCEWGEFKLVDLFHYERGTRLTKNNRITGKYPLVTAGEYNKGVKEYINNTNQKIFKNAITIDMFCNSFVHTNEFCCDDNILVLTAQKQMSQYAMLFISAVISKDKDKWGYGKQYRQNSLNRHKILLPITFDKKPNFALMEVFVKNLKRSHIKPLISYYKTLKVSSNWGGGVIFDYNKYKVFNSLKNLDSIFWREFNFDEVFLYKRGKRYKKSDHIKGDIAYISSSAFNNGVDNFVSPPSYMTIYQNKLTLANSGSVGTCFYHPYQFVASDHCMVIWLKERELNKEIALFLIPIFERFKDKHGFDWEINDERLRAESFLLPTDSKGNLAFEFMENTIKALKKEAVKNVILYNDAKIKATKKYIKTH